MAELWLLVTIFASAFAVAFSGAVPPGPMFAATVLHARSRGWSAGALVSLGHALLELGLLAAILAGAEGVLAHPVALRAIALAGGTFLAGMGLATLFAGQRKQAGDRPGKDPLLTDGMSKDSVMRGSVSSPGDPAAGAAPDARSCSAGGGGRAPWWRPFLAGIWTSVAQPLWPLWWALVGAGSVMAASRAFGYAGVAAFYAGHVLADIAWFTAVAAAVGAGGKVLSERGFRVLVRACGAILLGSGVAFGIGGVLLL